MSEGDSKKIGIPNLGGAITAVEKSDMAWKIEHASCPTIYTHLQNKDGKFTLFHCPRHNATHLTKGIHVLVKKG